ncbi:hypothetical protein BMS3Abin07_00967 [bacterium BMS3Abin07]|nr:hypothetical protein BMS3Abin07_00967 [bacterium BMS3Abin07]
MNRKPGRLNPGARELKDRVAENIGQLLEKQ